MCLCHSEWSRLSDCWYSLALFNLRIWSLLHETFEWYCQLDVARIIASGRGSFHCYCRDQILWRGVLFPYAVWWTKGFVPSLLFWKSLFEWSNLFQVYFYLARTVHMWLYTDRYLISRWKMRICKEQIKWFSVYLPVIGKNEGSFSFSCWFYKLLFFSLKVLGFDLNKKCPGFLKRLDYILI